MGHRLRQTAPVLEVWRRRSYPTNLALSTSLLILLTVGCLLGVGAVEAHDLITPGGRGPSAEVIAQDFGAEAVDPAATGYDGQQTYAIARHFPDLQAAAEQTDSGRYRMLRILPAVLAWPMPSGTPTVLALLVSGIIGFGLAVWATARLLESKGVPARLAPVACAPLLIGVFGSTTEPLAWGLALAALDLVRRDRHREAVALFALAALSRETTVVAAGLAGLSTLIRHPRAGLRVAPWYGVPAALALAWFLFLTDHVGGRWPGRTDPLAFLELDAGGLVVPAVVFALGVIGTVAWSDELALALPCAAFTAWMTVYTTNILDDAALIRVNAFPIILGLLAMVRLAQRGRTGGIGDASP
jgi:hypothetical protein